MIEFYILGILSILTHTKRWENVLKKETIVYIQKGLTLRYITQTLNPF